MAAKRAKKPDQWPMAVRIVRLHGRLAISVVFGVAVAAALFAANLNAATRLLIGWDFGTLLYLTLIYSVARRGDIGHLRQRAAEEDEGAMILLLLTFAAAVASLVAIVIEVGGSQGSDSFPAGCHVALAMGTIVLSWFFVHTEFALHYAHEFYGEGRDRELGGLKFPGRKEPDYWDFLYFSLVIAMTSQVSDVAITSRALRGVATMHGVLSFFFNLGILALTVNMLSNLIGGN
ncbi:MAG TPA: DUF1345 domain-containing protein [Pseudolabrys sp.]|jgi:uncharacterized membrane protein|nr:DUF1345 domain-containing protein [Pseudolabrys sp.]